MALSQLTIARKTFEYNGTDFSIRGLAFDDVSRILLDHEADVEKAMELVDAARSEEGEVNPGEAIALLVKNAPGLVAKLIAAAADEPDAWQNVLLIPFPKQLEIAMALGEMTFTEADSVKKFVANLALLIGKINTIKS